jgi:HEPN domain-containing protein
MRDSGAEAERWLRHTEHDLAFGRLALKERFFAQACFVAQTGEKALKAIAYAQGERVVIGHSLVELASRLQDRVATVRARREDAGILDPYYVPTRYPNGLAGGVPFEAFGEAQALAALAAAERFVELARTEVRPT